MYKSFKSLWLVLTGFLIAGTLSAQNRSGNASVPASQDPAFTAHPLTWPLPIKVNAMQSNEDWWPSLRNIDKKPEPGINKQKDLLRKLKAEANSKANHGIVKPNSTSKTQAGIPSLGAGYLGNSFDGGVPNDNHLAISDDGWVVSVVNSNIRMFNYTNSSPRSTNSLNNFGGGAGGGFTSKFDPRAIYDPTNDRFIVIYLSGFSSNTSNIVVAFSETNNPTGTWNVYTLTGNPLGNTNPVWTDFPCIGISSEELFITGNLFSNNQIAQGSVIWQVPLQNGYAGQALGARNFTSTSFFALYPVTGGLAPYGANMYFLRSNAVPTSSSRSISVHEITNSIANNGTLQSPVTLTSDLPYSIPPDAGQPSTNRSLSTNECRIQTAYLENNRIEYALNTNRNNRACIYHGTIQLSPFGLSFSLATAEYVCSDSLFIAYPGIAYGGCTSTQSGDNASLISFNFSSESHFPGNGVIFKDDAGTYSAPVIARSGISFVNVQSSQNQRWGDYADAVPKMDSPGEIWVVGSYGTSQNVTLTWISQILTSCSPVAVVPETRQQNEVNAWPNPAVEMVNFNFPVAERGMVTVEIFNLDGRKIRTISEEYLQPGTGRASFNTSMMASGVYLVRISDQQGAVYSEKFSVAR